MAERQNRPPHVIGEQDYPLRDQVRDVLRTRISEGDLAPGARLIEQVLADDFGVSRIPVREALRMLETEGLVKTLPRKGAVVTTLSRSDLEHLYDIREALEVMAFRLAAAHATAEEIGHLESILDQAEQLGNADHSQVSRLNSDFHDSVFVMTGNPFLSAILEPLGGRLRLMIGQSYDHERQLTEHAELLSALKSHDPDRAAAAALDHIRSSRQHALAHYDGLQNNQMDAG